MREPPCDSDPTALPSSVARGKSAQQLATEELITKLQQGRASAEVEFAEKYRGRLKNGVQLAFGGEVGPRGERASQVVENVLDEGSKALKKPDYAEATSGKRVWGLLKKICSCRVKDIFRKSGPRIVQEPNKQVYDQPRLAEMVVAHGASPSEEVGQREEFELVRNALRKVAKDCGGPKERLIELVYNPGEDPNVGLNRKQPTLAQLANELGCSNTRVRQHLARIEELVRDEIGEIVKAKQ